MIPEHHTFCHEDERRKKSGTQEEKKLAQLNSTYKINSKLIKVYLEKTRRKSEVHKNIEENLRSKLVGIDLWDIFMDSVIIARKAKLKMLTSLNGNTSN